MLSEKVKVNSRFQRSIKIDSDIEDQHIIESFICPVSCADILTNMAKGYSESNENSYTWTGPYGSGKSSLVLQLNGLIGKNPTLRKIAASKLDKSQTDFLLSKFKVNKKSGWEFIPIVGHKGCAEKALRQAFIERYGLKPSKKESTLEIIIKQSNKELCGTFIVIDEMGKFLEAAADGTGDVYFFQQLAETAARSNGKIMLLGILHQSFAEYARKMTREIRDEWTKIQGRFIDMPLNVAGEELLELISQAVICKSKPEKISAVAKKTASQIGNWRSVDEKKLSVVLNNCWPLHPVTAGLLGPISRRRFGQNQRSVFGFLNSSEPNGFQDFLKTTKASEKSLFYPARLWDYLRSNLEPSIMASPDGHRWSLAVDALSRAEASGADKATIDTIKSIALMDLFQERSGLVPEESLLLQCLPNTSKADLKKILEQLENWSIILYRNHKKSYSLYEGSDFDIESAIETALEQVSDVDFAMLKKAAGFGPVVAKRHYHYTGALRWMDIKLTKPEDIESKIRDYQPENGAMGLCLVVLGDEKATNKTIKPILEKAFSPNRDWPLLISYAKNSYLIKSHAKELQALEWIKSYSPELGGDTVARREVETRLSSIKSRLEEYFSDALTTATWYEDSETPLILNLNDLTDMASQKADALFSKSPKVNSELANRVKPSGNTNGAIKLLLKAMIENCGQPRLGIEGFPAEGGLYEILLKNTKLYDDQNFNVPTPKNDPCNLHPLWAATDKFFAKNSNRPVQLNELYDLWSAAPFGLKDGLLPFFAVSYVLTRINDYAVYLEDIYRPSIDFFFIENLLKSPKDIAFRKMNFSDVGQKILAGVCDTLNKLHPEDKILSETSEPLEIARRLVSSVINLPTWVLRTRKLSKNTIKLRELIKNASDPNKVLFDDLPNLFAEYKKNLDKGDVQPIINELDHSLDEMVNAYPNLLSDLHDELLRELQVKPNSGLIELNKRAENIIQISGDFKLDAFAARLSKFGGSVTDIEGIASLAADKPIKDWIDLDVNRAKLRIAELAQKFNHIEAYGRVHNRDDYRHAVAFMVGVEGVPQTFVREFTIKNDERDEVKDIEQLIRKSIKEKSNINNELLLAALANIGADLLKDLPNETDLDQKVSA